MLRKLVTMDGMCKGHFIAIGTLWFRMHKLNKAMSSCLKVNSLLYTRNQVWKHVWKYSLDNSSANQCLTRHDEKGSISIICLFLLNLLKCVGQMWHVLSRVSLSPAPYLWPLIDFGFLLHTVNCGRFVFGAVFCVWNISGTAERICAKCAWKMCLVPRLEEFKGQGHHGQKTAFLGSFAGLRAVYVW